MGLFQSSASQAVPGGNYAKPLMIAIGALLLKKMLTPSAPAPQSHAAEALPPAASGGLLEGLGGLVGKFQGGGYGDIINSWIGKGPNQPIDDQKLSNALGSDELANLAKKAGMSQQELLQQLSKALPTLIDKLTPDGRLPTQSEIEKHY